MAYRCTNKGILHPKPRGRLEAYSNYIRECSITVYTPTSPYFANSVLGSVDGMESQVEHQWTKKSFPHSKQTIYSSTLAMDPANNTSNPHKSNVSNPPLSQCSLAVHPANSAKQVTLNPSEHHSHTSLAVLLRCWQI